MIGFYPLGSSIDTGVLITPDRKVVPAQFMYPGAARAKAKRLAEQERRRPGKTHRVSRKRGLVA